MKKLILSAFLFSLTSAVFADPYAQIQSGTVVNVILASPSDYFDPTYTWVDVLNVTPQPQTGWNYNGTTFSPPGVPNDAYGNTVTFSTDGTYDYYAVAGYPTIQVSHGTSQAVPYLAMAKQENLTLAQAAVQQYTTGRYSLDVRYNLSVIERLAADSGLINRDAYVKQLFTWAQSVVTYGITYMATVQAMTDPAAIAATVPNFTTLTSSDPLVTPQGALAISN
jgi:hypothetical protein